MVRKPAPATRRKSTSPVSSARPAAKAAKVANPGVFLALNVNSPGKTYPCNAAKYEAARKVLLTVLPRSGPGVTQSEMMALMKASLPGDLFGTTTGWWTKLVQLDAEARGDVFRDGGKPLRWKRK